MSLRKTALPKRPRQDGADELNYQTKVCGTIQVNPVREFKFHPDRKWRLDLAWPESKLAVEVEGFSAGGSAGRHQRPAGFDKDCEKYAELAIAGWRLIRVTTKQVKDGRALQWIERALA